MTTKPTLGTLLRSLIEHLDGAVEQAYTNAGLNYKPRYTPIVRALSALGPATIRAISTRASISHSAVSQTVSEMRRQGLLAVQVGADARERLISLTPEACAMLPALQRQWAATNTAANSLDKELAISLPDLLERTLQILERRSFADRIEDAVRQGLPDDIAQKASIPKQRQKE